MRECEFTLARVMMIQVLNDDVADLGMALLLAVARRCVHMHAVFTPVVLPLQFENV